MKCLVYGIYFIELVQSILVIETGFRTFVTSFGNVEVFDRIETLWLSVPILTAIGEFSYIGHKRYLNIKPRYILCPRILCPSDQHFSTIEESRGSDYCCKSSKNSACIQGLKVASYIALFHPTWWWDSSWG